MSDSVRPSRRQPIRLPRPWDSPGKNTRVGCHFLLQCMKVKSENEVAQSCPTLCDPMDCNLSGSSVHEIFQAKVLEWIAISFSRGSSRPRSQTRVSRIASPWGCKELDTTERLSSRDCSPAGSSVHEILQAGILEWVAISSSRGSPQPRD